MAIVKKEFEIPSSVSASKLFKAFTEFHKIGPKILPETFKTIVHIQGNGGAGSIQETTFADGSKMKNTIDAIDYDNFTITYTVFEGGAWMENLKTLTNIVKLVPTANGGSVYKVSSVYKCKDQGKFTPEDAKLAEEGTKYHFKAVEAYVIANPNAY